jgi:hypothetical protein
MNDFNGRPLADVSGRMCGEVAERQLVNRPPT